MSPPTIGRFAFLVALLLSPFPSTVASPVLWQEPTSPPAETSQEAPATVAVAQASAATGVQPIDEADIPARADVMTAELRRIQAFLEPTPEIGSIEAELDAIRPLFVQWRVELDGIDAERVYKRELSNHRVPWIDKSEDLEAWESRVFDRYNTLVEQRNALREHRAVWDATAAPPSVDDLTPQLLRRVDAVWQRLVEVEQLARERRNATGVVLDDISEAREIVRDSLARLDDIEERIGGRLFERNVEPLWRALGADAPPVFSQVGFAADAWLEALRNYVLLLRGRLALLFVIFAVLLAGSVAVRRKMAGYLTDDELSIRAHALLQRPFALSLGLSLVFAATFFPYQNGSMLDLVVIVSVFTTIRIGAAVVSPQYQWALYVFSALAVLERASSITPDAALLDRLVLLLVTGLALAACVRITIPRPDEEHGRSRWRRVATAVGFVAAVLLVSAAAANILGFTDLARLLTEATIKSLFSAVGWVVAAKAVAVLLPVLLTDWAGGQLRSLRRNRDTVSHTTLTLLSVVAVYHWIWRVLLAFQVARPVQDLIATALARTYELGGLSASIGDLLGAVVILLATWAIAHLAAFVLREEILPRLRLARGAPQSVLALINYSIWGVGIALAASAAGLTGTQLAVVIGALSVGIGFGLQTIVNNFVSGLILIFERPIKVGDILEMPGYWGRVDRIGIRASVITSFDGAEIMVPNGDLIAKEVINWTRSNDMRRAEVLVGVAYGTDPEQVLELLLRVAKENPTALEDPEPRAHMLRFGDSSLDFRLRAWTPMENWVDLQSELNVGVNKALKDAGITIPFPQRDLHIKSHDAKDDAL